MEAIKISVVVPVYKVEAYLDKCVESIVNQTYKNLEIILVDDESPDSCPEICDKWAGKDSRIKVIHKKNGGEVNARMSGVEAATADYIGFVDSDDYIEPDMYEYLLSKFSDDVDIVRCCYNKVYEDGTPSYIVGDGADTVESSAEFLERMLGDNSLNSNCWTKLYRKSVVEDYSCPENIKIGGDHLFNYTVLKKVRNVAVCSEAKYNYLVRGSSITNIDNNISSWLQNVGVHRYIFEQEKSASSAKAFAGWLLDSVALCVKGKVKSSDKQYKEIRKILNSSYSDLSKALTNKKVKIKLLLFKYCPHIYMSALKFYLGR